MRKQNEIDISPNIAIEQIILVCMDEDLTIKYLQLGSTLENTYPELTFKNHCYWRIALDNTLSEKWDNVIERPAYKNLTGEQLEKVVDLLDKYQSDKHLLMTHNKKSLQYRTE